MPKTSDYSKSLIYKIEHLDNPELVYVGSTVNIIKRRNHHKSDYNNEKSKRHNLKIYRMMRENGGWECFKMVVIKEYPCNTRIELEIEEEKCRKELQATLNTLRCHITKEEKKEIGLKYRLENIDVVLEKQRQYRLENKDVINENQRQKYLENKDIINEKQRQTYLENKDVINENRGQKIKCDICNCSFSKSFIYRHNKTKKHLKFINL